jgi:hypothetical protein
MNGPFFDMDTGIGIGRKKIDGMAFDQLFMDYFSPWEYDTTPMYMRGFGSINKAETLSIKSPIDLSPTVFEDSTMYFEGTPLIIDKTNSINNFFDDGGAELLSSNTLKTTYRGYERNYMGLPFIGISSYNDTNYFISITLDDVSSVIMPKLKEVFYILFLLTQEMNVEKLIFTDGSDSLLLKYGTEIKHEIDDYKNAKMPFYFGIRKI